MTQSHLYLPMYVYPVCNKDMFYSNINVLLTSTYESMHKHIIQSSVTSQTTHNTLQTSIVKCPIQAMSVQITLENSIRCTSERIEKLSTTVSDTYRHPMSTRFVGRVGVADE